MNNGCSNNKKQWSAAAYVLTPLLLVARWCWVAARRSCIDYVSQNMCYKNQGLRGACCVEHP